MKRILIIIGIITVIVITIITTVTIVIRSSNRCTALSHSLGV